MLGIEIERELACLRELPTVVGTFLAPACLFTMKRPLPPLLFALGVALILVSEYLPGAEAFPAWTRIVGAIAMSAGLILLVIARLQFAKAKTNILTFGEPGQLVTTGVFRLSRNPMYLGFALLLLGLALAMRSLPAVCVAAAFALITDRWYIGFEERWLSAKFGAAYEAYACRTRRWLGWSRTSPSQPARPTSSN